MDFYWLFLFLFGVNFVFLLFIYKNTINNNHVTNWREEVLTYYLSTSELAYIFKDQKFLKVLDHKSNPIVVKRKNVEFLSTYNKVVKIRKYRFRAKDFNSLGLQINLDLKFADKEKGLIYINKNPMGFNDCDRNKIETLVEMDIVTNLQNILKEYTRKEFFGNVEEITQKFKTSIEKIVREKTGYEIQNLWIFELNV